MACVLVSFAWYAVSKVLPCCGVCQHFTPSVISEVRKIDRRPGAEESQRRENCLLSTVGATQSRHPGWVRRHPTRGRGAIILVFLPDRLVLWVPNLGTHIEFASSAKSAS